MDKRKTVGTNPADPARPFYGLDGRRRRPRQAHPGAEELIELPATNDTIAVIPEPRPQEGPVADALHARTEETASSHVPSLPPGVLDRWTAESTERAAERVNEDVLGLEDRFEALRSELVSELRRQIGGAVDRIEATFEAEVDALRTLNREEAKRFRSANGEAFVRIRASDTQELERIRASIDDGIGRLCGIIDGQLDRVWSANDDELERIRSTGAERLAEVHDLLNRELERLHEEQLPTPRRRWLRRDEHGR